MGTKYFEIDNMQFKLEMVSDSAYCLELYENGEFFRRWMFGGSTAYADALAEILSYAEIDEKDYAGTKEE